MQIPQIKKNLNAIIFYDYIVCSCDPLDVVKNFLIPYQLLYMEDL